jgi:hypothetical protein
MMHVCILEEIKEWDRSTFNMISLENILIHKIDQPKIGELNSV